MHRVSTGWFLYLRHSVCREKPPWHSSPRKLFGKQGGKTSATLSPSAAYQASIDTLRSTGISILNSINKQILFISILIPEWEIPLFKYHQTFNCYDPFLRFKWCRFHSKQTEQLIHWAFANWKYSLIERYLFEQDFLVTANVRTSKIVTFYL